MNPKTTKIILIYLALSFVIIFFASYVHLGIIYVDLLYTWSYLKLANYFKWLLPWSIAQQVMTQQIIALVTMPLIIVGVPALIYRLIFKKNVAYFYESIWIIWLLIVLSNYLIR
jgi:hypothetical protein